ncbi:putative F-box protein At4g38870 [Papaver somniferum]|uniref:putative F-box protein At4g38870 n=1 Tax=Papaver somniferum TaxID=3469 RepID=UPI000E703C5E|nr:putative F-box protein At4g38870 [Papaver somniferum]
MEGKMMSKKTKRSSNGVESGDSKAVMDEENVVNNIVSRLPLKSLMRFKCVAKRWCNLFQDPYFIDLHLNHRLKPPLRLSLFVVLPRRRCNRKGGNLSMDIEFKGRRVVFLIADVFFDERGWNGKGNVASTITHIYNTTPFSYTQMLGGVNGVVCFVDGSMNAACLFNIGTREVTPWIKSTLLMEETQNCKNSVSYTCLYSFGYDPIGKEHKVICRWAINKDNGLTYQIWEILTVVRHNNAWRRIDQVPICKFSPDSPSVYVNGSIYWYPLNLLRRDSNVGILLAFDVGSEKFRTIKIPDFIELEDGLLFSIKDVFLLNLQNHVSVLRRSGCYTARLWIYKEDDRGMGKVTDSDIGGKNRTQMTIVLPVSWGTWDASRNLLFHSAAGTHQILLEIHQKNAAGTKVTISLYSCCIKDTRLEQIELKELDSVHGWRGTRLCTSFNESLIL